MIARILLAAAAAFTFAGAALAQDATSGTISACAPAMARFDKFYALCEFQPCDDAHKASSVGSLGMQDNDTGPNRRGFLATVAGVSTKRSLANTPR